MVTREILEAWTIRVVRRLWRYRYIRPIDVFVECNAEQYVATFSYRVLGVNMEVAVPVQLDGLNPT